MTTTSNDRTAYWREWRRKRRLKARKEGKCGQCCTRKPQRGYATCRTCIDANLDRYYANK